MDAAPAVFLPCVHGWTNNTDQKGFIVTAVFRGRFDCRIDPKGRLNLPAAYRQSLSAFSKSKQAPTLVITNGLYKGRRCLDLFPLKEWENLERQMDKMPALKAEVQAYRRFYLASGQTVQVDSQNRILIPSSLRRYGDLNEEVVLVGMGKKIEIWSAPIWQEFYEGMAANFDDILTAVAALEENLD